MKSFGRYLIGPKTRTSGLHKSKVKNRIELAKYFGKRGFKNGAEIGVWRGRYSEILCQNIPGLKLICVDIWEKEHVYREAVKRLAQYDTKLIKKPSTEAAKAVPNESLDFVYIDANHSYKFVKEDVSEWTKKVRKGGIVAGHDYYIFKWSGERGVVDAVDEYTKENGYQLLTIGWDKTAPARDDRVPCWYFSK